MSECNSGYYARPQRAAACVCDPYLTRNGLRWIPSLPQAVNVTAAEAERLEVERLRAHARVEANVKAARAIGRAGTSSVA
jgi:hypothetical protein